MDDVDGIPPPGDPSKAKKSWRDTVILGGVDQPRTIISDDFIANKIKVFFLNGEEGDPAVLIEESVIGALASVWNNSLVVRLLRSAPPLYVMEKKIREIWRDFGRL